MVKQKYTLEFKQGAIELVEQQGLSCAVRGSFKFGHCAFFFVVKPNGVWAASGDGAKR